MTLSPSLSFPGNQSPLNCSLFPVPSLTKLGLSPQQELFPRISFFFFPSYHQAPSPELTDIHVFLLSPFLNFSIVNVLPGRITQGPFLSKFWLHPPWPPRDSPPILPAELSTNSFSRVKNYRAVSSSPTVLSPTFQGPHNPPFPYIYCNNPSLAGDFFSLLNCSRALFLGFPGRG